MRVLAILSDRVDPPITGTRVRNRGLWPAVQGLGVELKCLAPDRFGGDAPAQGPPGVETEFFRFRREPLPLRAANALSRSYHEWPRSAELAARVDRLAAAWRPDVIHAEELNGASYLPGLRGRPAEALQTLTLHNVESALYERIGASPVRFGAPLVRWLHQRNLRAYERRAVELADIAFAYSEDDREAYRRLYPRARWSVTRNGIDVRGIEPAPQPADGYVLFLGALGYAPNVRGLAWYLDEVMPRLPAEVRLTVAGSKAGPEVRERIARAGVDFADTPLDLAPVYAGAAIAAVPILEGSGTRGKILEALAYERFVVTTTKGAEGLDLREGEGLTFADDPGEFAAAIVRALGDPAGRAASAARGRQAALERYDWSVAARGMVECWEAALARGRGGEVVA